MALLKLVPPPLLSLVGPPSPLFLDPSTSSTVRFPEDGFYLLFHATEHAILSREKFYLKIISYMSLPFFPCRDFLALLIRRIFFISAIIEVSVKFCAYARRLKKIQEHTTSNSFGYCFKGFPSHEQSR